MKRNMSIANLLLAITGRFVAVIALIVLTIPAQATLYLGDAIPCDTSVSTDYAASDLYDQNPTISTITGGTGKWGTYPTGTQHARDTGLSYPAASSINSSGGCLATRHDSSSETGNGRYLTRLVSNVPTNGTIYLSILIQMETLTSASGWTVGDEQCGAGFVKASIGDTKYDSKMPTTGIFFGFEKTSSGVRLVAKIGGTNVELVESVSGGTTYHCMAKVQINAGTGGAEIVSTSVNPSMPLEPATWDDSREIDFLSAGQTLKYYAVGGTYSTANHDISYDEYSISSKYYSEAFGDEPLISFESDATGVSVASASSVSVSNKASFVSATTPELYVCYGATEGNASTSSWDYVELVTDTPVADTQYSKTLDSANLTADKLYYCALVATNSTGSLYYPLPTFLTGEISVVKTKDAEELGVVSGIFTLSRPAGATQGDLEISYTVSGTAVAGINYVDNLTGTVTIEAGETNATITVTPIFDAATSSDTTVILTPTPTTYLVASPGSATMTIENAEPPAGKNTWVAPTNSVASIASNWSEGRIPNSTDDIYLDVFSDKDMVWDVDGVNGLSDTVASWTQTSNYTGTVTFPITYAEESTTFTNFTINGNCEITGGTWTHTGNEYTQLYKLKATITGNFTLGEDADIDIKGKGKTSNSGGKDAYGGMSGTAKTFGDPKYPTDLGLGQYWYYYSTHVYGGGAVHLDVTGDAEINGTISSDGTTASKIAASGGSILIEADNISGSGSMSAKATYDGSDWCYDGGSGGRIALVAENSNTFPSDSILAYGAVGGSTGAAGTIFLSDSAHTNGTLIVDNYNVPGNNFHQRPYTPSYVATTVNEGETWTFDRIIVKRAGILAVPATSKLVLPNGLVSVSSTDSTPNISGIRLDGGELDAGNYDPQIISSNWCFQITEPTTNNWNVVVRDSGAIGVIKVRSSTTYYAAMKDWVLDGDLTVDDTGYIYAEKCSFWTKNDSTWYATYKRGAHGGSCGSYAESTNTYDSILNPYLPGNAGGDGNNYRVNEGGGTISFTVTGNLELNGTAKSDGYYGEYSSKSSASAGSLNLTLGSLSGTGSISASVPQYSNYARPGAGRIAIRLTDEGATFDDFGVENIKATGYASSSAAAADHSSAGTVYLETAADNTDAGTIFIRNAGNTSTAVKTQLPGFGEGCDTAEDIENTALVVEGISTTVNLTDDVIFTSVSVTDGEIDLNGKDLTTAGLTIDGSRVSSGVYSADDPAVSDAFADSSTGETGIITVTSTGTIFIIQ